MGNNKEALISIIIPVYNEEKYLKRCIESVINQTWRNIEIILVNDGSTDNSGKICDSFQKIDHRIKVIHKENGGLSSSRNMGLNICNGEYIGFVDSDDWIAADMYEYMFNLMKENNADIIQTCIQKTSNYPGTTKVFEEKISILKDKEILQDYMYKCTTVGQHSVCSCLFKKSVIGTIRFRVGKICEDTDFKYKVLKKCKICVSTNEEKYFYFQATGSISTSGLRKKDFELYEAAELLYELSKDETYGTISFLGEVKKARTAFSLLCKIAYYGISDDTIDKKNLVKKLTREHRGNLKILLKSPMQKNRKIVALVLAINYYLLEILVKIAKKLKII